MAELHPEECRSSLYWVGQRRQVGNSDLLTAYLSNLQSNLPISHFLVSPSPDHITAPQAPKIPEALVMRWLFKLFWPTINGQGVKRSSGEWGYRTLEFKAPFNTCSSQRELGKGEGWWGLWSLVPLWHLRNRSWLPTVPVSVYVFLLELLSACNHLFCLRLLLFIFFLFFNGPANE